MTCGRGLAGFVVRVEGGVAVEPTPAEIAEATKYGWDVYAWVNAGPGVRSDVRRRYEQMIASGGDTPPSGDGVGVPTMKEISDSQKYGIPLNDWMSMSPSERSYAGTIYNIIEAGPPETSTVVEAGIGISPAILILGGILAWAFYDYSKSTRRQ